MTDMRLTEHLLLLVHLWRISLECISKPKNILQEKQRELSRSSTVGAWEILAYTQCFTQSIWYVTIYYSCSLTKIEEIKTTIHRYLPLNFLSELTLATIGLGMSWPFPHVSWWSMRGDSFRLESALLLVITQHNNNNTKTIWVKKKIAFFRGHHSIICIDLWILQTKERTYSSRGHESKDYFPILCFSIFFQVFTDILYMVAHQNYCIKNFIHLIYAVYIYMFRHRRQNDETHQGKYRKELKLHFSLCSEPVRMIVKYL